MNIIFLSLGSNVEPKKHLKAAMQLLQIKFQFVVSSPVYQSEAVGFTGLPFLNNVVRAQTKLSLEETLSLLKDLEAQLGRMKEADKFSDRTMDIDLLLFNDMVTSDSVVLPRQDILEYSFVLKPLADIAPTEKHPILQQSYQSLWQSFLHNTPLTQVEL